eukprot:413025-Ditylum_brightwellii.AAC.1
MARETRTSRNESRLTLGVTLISDVEVGIDVMAGFFTSCLSHSSKYPRPGGASWDKKSSLPSLPD